jgi:plastocyanin
MQRLIPLLWAGLLVLLVAACGSGSAGPSVPAQTLGPDSPRIVAKDVKFTTPSVTAPADRVFAIDFDNQDAAPHNVAIYDGTGANVFRGDIFGGSSHRVYSVAALAAGTYTFKCDVHPDMTGTLVAS